MSPEIDLLTALSTQLFSACEAQWNQLLHRLFLPGSFVPAIQAVLTISKALPAIDPSIGSGTGTGESGLWWVKFIIDIDHPMACRIVQELGHVLNYVSLNERLPTVFMPVSPPPYVNGGPRNFLSWVIESSDAGSTPSDCAIERPPIIARISLTAFC